MNRRRHRHRKNDISRLGIRWRRRMARITPSGLAGRIIFLVGGILLVVQVVSWVFGDDDDWKIDQPENIIADQIVAATLLLDGTAPSQRAAITTALSGLLMRVEIDGAPGPAKAPRWAMAEIQEKLDDLLAPLGERAFRVGHLDEWSWDGVIVLSVQLQDGNWVIYRFPIRTLSLYEEGGWGIGTVVFWLFVIGCVFWFSNHLARPIGTFADAADRLGRDVNVKPLPVTGSRELRRAATAFNNMQTRIQRLVDDRALMLAAIAHDLRTVLTRLRLRAEFIEDAEQQDKAAADIEEMQAMLDAGLAFARGETEVEERRTTDLAALVRGLTEDFSRTDGPASYQGPDHLPYRCGTHEIRRAVSNLIRNAIVYGSKADVHLSSGPLGITVSITDEGPGIPPELHENVFQPFFRVESSRNRSTGGTGLGLAIARTIARRHGGDITFKNGPERGLTATLSLPSSSSQS